MMKHKSMLISLLAVICLSLLTVGGSQAQEPEGDISAQAALGTAFTFEGRLTDGGGPANSTYDFQFRLYAASSGGSQIDSLNRNDVTVTEGLFIVELDFGAVFDGTARWLEIGVRPGNSTGGYTTLLPRQRLTPTPYALFSQDTNLLDGYDSADFLRASGGTLNGNFYVTGNVGVGTTSPDRRLTVYHSGSAFQNLKDGTRELVMGVDPNGGIISVMSDHDLILRAGQNDEKMRVRANGNVGINTSNPQAKLHVAGQSRFDGISQFNLGTGSVSMSTPGGWPGIIAYSPNGHRKEIVFKDDKLQLVMSTSSAPSPNDNGITIRESGNVGIGTVNPQQRLDVSGTTRTQVLEITGGSDLAEPFEIAGPENIKPGLVVAIDPEHPGQLRLADKAYDHTVAGCISGANGIKPGLVMQQAGSVAEDAFPVALSGRVYCWADVSNGPIQPGDLLTSATRPGHAMKVTDYAKAQGAILGKAMSSLETGQGLVLVLVTLQ